jgi:peptide/nickel transport system ATP-binding protein
MSAPEPILSVRDLAVSFDGRPAVRGVSFDLAAGEALAIVGESGSGKSVTAMSLLRLLPPSAQVDSGAVTWRADSAEIDALRARPRALRRLRGGVAAVVFQEPMTSLNPVLSIGDQIVEALRLHRGLRGRAAGRAAADALDAVGIPEPNERLRSYPHEFSGGMRQRAMIAMALACEPKLLIADEPTTALDVTVQAQILDLLDRLRAERGLALLLITHDLAVAHERAERVAVMYAGRLVETGPMRDVLASPAHPYTRGLIGSIPRLDRRDDRLPTVHVEPAEASLECGLTAWWPAHEPPSEVDPERPATLVPAGKGRRVLVWSTPEARSRAAPEAKPCAS